MPSLSATGFTVVEQFIDPPLARTLYAMLLLRRARGEYKRDDQVADALSFWGDSTLDALLLGLLPEVEHASGCSLLPTYSYARLYLPGNELKRHSDRDACEIAVTIHLGRQGIAPPPICFAPGVAVTQHPGDAVVYFGTQVEHWRDTFHGDNFGQVFLNYVRADGSSRRHMFDGRQDAYPPEIVQPLLVRAGALGDAQVPA